VTGSGTSLAGTLTDGGGETDQGGNAEQLVQEETPDEHLDRSVDLNDGDGSAENDQDAGIVY
jgi:hypothetical protein